MMKAAPVRYVIYPDDMTYSVMLGDLWQCELHRHYSMHLMLALRGKIEVQLDRTQMNSKHAMVIGSNQKHGVPQQSENPLMIISLGPISNLGLYIQSRLKGASFSEFCHPLVDELRLLGEGLYGGRLNRNQFAGNLQDLFEEMAPHSFDYCEEVYDCRIVKALQIIIVNSEQIFSAEEIARELNLSTSRFLHLFKSNVGISYRRMQNWIKLVHSFKLYPHMSSLTEIAHTSGFSDSAHYSRSFKETFGLSPSFFFQG